MSATKKIVHNGDKAVISRENSPKNGGTRIIKSLKRERLNYVYKKLCENEYEKLRILQISGVSKLVGDENGNPTKLYFQDFDGVTLREYSKKIVLSIDEFLKIAIKLCRIVERVHAKNVIHTRINPDHALINDDTEETLLIDFSESRISGSSRLFDMKYFDLKNLEFIAPELTESSASPVDERTDLYSLGALYYFMLSGKAPIENKNREELLFEIVTKKPRPLAEENPDVPEGLSKIIETLLEKNPEDRYQSCAGLLMDLRTAERMFIAEKNVGRFPLSNKAGEKLIIETNKFIGRALEIDMLSDAFTRSKFAKDLTIISGSRGIGKTFLAREFEKKIIELDDVIFLSGNFDDEALTSSYSAVFGLLSKIPEIVLSKNPQQRRLWKEAAAELSAKESAALIHYSPAFETIAPAKNDNAPAPNRSGYFVKAASKLIRKFADKGARFIFFLDNVHNASASGLESLKAIFANNDSPNSLLVFATDSEIAPPEELKKSLFECGFESVPTTEIALGGLSETEIIEMTAEATRAKKYEISKLGKLIFKKTNGSPLHAKHLINELYRERKIFFDQSLKAWRWDAREINRYSFPDSLSKIIEKRVKALPNETAQVLNAASCFGAEFDLNTLAKVCGEKPGRLNFVLLEAARNNIVFTTGDTPDSLLFSENSDQIYGFCCDKVRKSIYSELPNEKREEIHYKIASGLLSEANWGDPERLLSCVHHVKQAEELLKSNGEYDKIVNVYFEYGRIAKASGDATQAAQAFEGALEAACERNGEEYESKMTKIMLELADAYFVTGEYAKAESTLDKLFENAKSDLDKIKGYEISVKISSARLDYASAFETARKAFSLSKSFRELPESSVEECAKVVRVLSSKNLDEIELIADPEILSVMRIAAAILPIAFFTKSPTYSVYACKVAQITARYGIAPESAFGLTAYAEIMASAANPDIDLAFDAARLALEIIKKTPDTEIETKVKFLYDLFISHHKEPLSKRITALEKEESSAYGGEYQPYAIQRGLMLTSYKYHAGENIAETAKFLDEFYKKREKYFDDRFKRVYNLYRQFLEAHINYDSQNIILDGKYQNIGDALSEIMKAKDANWLASFYVKKGFLLFLYGEYMRAFAAFKEAEKHERAIKAQYVYTDYITFYALSILKVIDDFAGGVKENAESTIERVVDELKAYSARCPENFKKNLALVEAQLASNKGEYFKAMEFFDEAAQASLDSGFVNYAAIVYELFGQTMEKAEKYDVSRLYFEKSVETYKVWGAEQKITQMIENRPELKSALENKSRASRLEAGEGARRLEEITNIFAANGNLESKFKSALKTICKFARASSVSIYFRKSDLFAVKADYDLHSDQFAYKTREGESLSGELNPIFYRCFRSGEQRIIPDAENCSDFKSFYSIKKGASVKSAMCIPLVFLGESRGALYIENRNIPLNYDEEFVGALKFMAAIITPSADAQITSENFEDFLSKKSERFKSKIKTLQNKLNKNEKETNKGVSQSDDLAQFFLQSKDGFGLIGSEGIIEDWNPAMETISGIPREDAVGSYLWDVQTSLAPETEKREEQREYLKKMTLDALKTKSAYWLGTIAELEFNSVAGDKKYIQSMNFLVEGSGETKIGWSFRDVTIQKIVENKLKEKEKLLLAILENSQDIIYMIDIDSGEFDYKNPKFKNKLSLTQKEFDNLNLLNILRMTHPEDRAKHSSYLKSALRRKSSTNKVSQIQFRLIRKDGSYRYFSDHHVFISSNESRRGKMIGVMRDVTNEKVAERALIESDKRHRLLFHSSPIPIIELDCSEMRSYFNALNPAVRNKIGDFLDSSDDVLKICAGQIRFRNANRACLKLFGESDESRFAANFRFFERMAIENKSVLKRILINLHDRRDSELEIKSSNAGGEPKDLYLKTSYLTEEGEDRCEVIMSLIDVSDRKKMENALRVSEAKARSLIDAQSDFMLLIDSDGTILDLNDSAIKNYKLPRNEIIGRVAFDFLPKELAESRKNYIDKALQNNAPVRFQDSNHGRLFDNTIYPIEGYSGEKKAVVVSARDITEIKNNESELLRINDAKDRFFSIMAHDLKSPFAGLFSLLDYVGQNSEEFEKDEILEYFEDISGILHKQYNLLTNMLNWSRSQLGALSFEPEEINARDLVEHVYGVYGQNAEAKNIKLVNSVEKGKLIWADFEMINAIARNLISNAIKFTRENGVIEVGIEEDKKYDRIYFKDAGVGISDERQARLFKIDKTARTLGTKGEEGTGLGLVICKEFVEKHGGMIDLSSAPDVGSVFTVSLPKAPEDKPKSDDDENNDLISQFLDYK